MTTTTAVIALIYSLILLGLAVGAYKWLKSLAAKDKFLACFVPPNEAVGIRRGGAFHRFLFDGGNDTHLNDPHSWQYLDTFRPWERIPNRWKPEVAGKMHPEFVYKDERNWFTRLTGVYFFWPWLEEVDKYEFTWSTYHGTTVDNAGVPQHNITLKNKQLVRSFYVKITQYHWRVAATTLDNQAVLGDFTFDLDGINPYEARFSRDNFLGHVQSLIEAELRNYVGSQSLDQLLSETDNAGHPKFYETYISPKDAAVQGSYGVSIKSVHILSFKVAPGPASALLAAKIELKAAEVRTKTVEQTSLQKERDGQADNRVKQGAADVEVNKARALMEIRTGTPAATQIAMAEAWFKGATVVSVGDKGITPLLNLPANTALAPAGAGTTTT